MSTTNSQNAPTTERSYSFKELEAKWMPVWEDLQVFKPLDDGSKERRYVLDMFPYPSGDLHMGHAEAFAMADVVARYWKLRGYDVLHPIGWDSFGLPAENAAIKNNAHPSEWTYANIETQAESFKRFAIASDWSRRLHTSDPEYYKWTQWIFQQLHKAGLAYRKDHPVNWCPKDQTVLANEQVVGGLCERCGTEVTKKTLNQWYFKITEYAEELLADMEGLHGHWPERVLAMQNNWIGKSTGATVRFQIKEQGAQAGKDVTVYTTRPDTLYGATFMVVAADAALAEELVAPEHAAELDAYREQLSHLSDIDRLSTERKKTGVYLGRTAINPLSGEEIPVWASDYVLADYGTGMIMAVPAHDDRDIEFAAAMDLPIRMVVDTGEEDPAVSKVATMGDGVLVNSGPLNGLPKDEAIAKAIELLGEAGTGEAATNYRLRDWLISRQRFWGTPIPVVHCDDCGEVLVPEAQLPVTLPEDMRGEDLAPKGQSPLAANDDWKNVPCPQCGGAAVRDTDTMDTFVDSSWYFLRYIDPNNDEKIFDSAEVNKWGPVDQYVGGVEHAILHLLYSRFLTKVLHDLKLIDFDEPFSALLNQGQVLNGGKAMSKSLGNGVDLGEQLDLYGVDAIRLTMVFASPPEDDIDWADVSPGASVKFLNRAWRLAADLNAAGVGPDVDYSQGATALRQATHKTVDEAARLLDSQRFNVVIARTMELVNTTRKQIDSGAGVTDPAVHEAVTVVAQLLSLVAPYTAEEMWELLGYEPSVATSSWLEVDPALLVEDTITAVAQVKGKVRDRFEVSPNISEEELEALALASANVQRAIGDKGVRMIINRAPKLINIVPNN
ncbi:leucine--tRNA ligase [Micrococcoides hystricis]|uniref:Leucine--tRNA ligase n=1 Tax=Micrococcoides hystricis TaxID=1572761 RepID=A0ABV6P7F4_9MICC